MGRRMARASHMKQTKSQIKRKKKGRHTNFKIMKAQFGHESIQKAWDPRKTVEQNYVELGLTIDANARGDIVKQAKRLGHFDIEADVSALADRMAEEESDNSDYFDGELDEKPQPNAKHPKSIALTAELARMQQEAEEVALIPKALKVMSINEQHRLKLLIEKHGDDFQAMSRDIKLNVMQHNPNQLIKRIEHMHKLQNADSLM